MVSRFVFSPKADVFSQNGCKYMRTATTGFLHAVTVHTHMLTARMALRLLCLDTQMNQTHILYTLFGEQQGQQKTVPRPVPRTRAGPPVKPCFGDAQTPQMLGRCPYPTSHTAQASPSNTKGQLPTTVELGKIFSDVDAETLEGMPPETLKKVHEAVCVDCRTLGTLVACPRATRRLDA